ncbi:MAG: protein-tyrosine-phosphatase [Saprospiraceae bacterium]|nr:protein-tyrosine-phosphatase [Saprospiraceae bacterium]
MKISKELSRYVEELIHESALIPDLRKEKLQQLATYIAKKILTDFTVQLIFICTHNSRRSHIAQIWAATAATWFDLSKVLVFSGGTEATAFNPRAVNALCKAGFEIEGSEGTNPEYLVYYGENKTPLKCFSKTYDHLSNPKENFAAIMTCSDAEENCPFIPGAEFRLALTYDDPKVADNTPDETTRYTERVRQIGREIFFAFSLIKQQIK